MNTIALDGSMLVGGSCGGCSDGPTTQIPIGWGGTCCSELPFAVDSGLVQRTINETDYIELPGVGTDQAVTQGLMLYFLLVSGSVTMKRTTYAQPDDLVAEEPVGGLVILQYPAGAYLKKLEVKGSGVIRYLVAGQL